MSPDKPVEEEQEMVEVEVKTFTKCKKCAGRCRLGGLDRCRKKIKALDADHKNYMPPCDVVNPNGECADYQRKQKTRQGVTVEQGE